LQIKKPIWKRLSFIVGKKEYGKQYLTIKDKSKVNPHGKALTRILKEKKIQQEILAEWTSPQATLKQFIMPVQGHISSHFGLRRYYNKQAHSAHTGIDIAAPTGTPILAAASGQVVATGNFFFSGNIVYIDHGHGLITIYCHLNAIKTKPGTIVQQGEVIGTVGQTGRVTGPHLHWTIALNKVKVDPLMFVNL